MIVLRLTSRRFAMVNTMTLVRQRVVEAAPGVCVRAIAMVDNVSFPLVALVVVYSVKGADELQEVQLGLATPAPALADNGAQQVD
jgi:hypothetical protein